ncbi:unnamed protein product [Prorocentrum cordatum]|uniref:Uncharacterized protein n=1 Tax=Prorocentrum cordatum TaxID=2364126 RepID=A0ABN9XEH5_9DINO|nr:unnamed protein product [Polarella glacialis]
MHGGCLPPPALPLRGGAARCARLRASLGRLRSALQAAPEDVRRRWIQGLQPRVRGALLQFMEACPSPARTPCPRGEELAQGGAASAGAAAARAPPRKPAAAKAVAGLQRGRRGLYRAKICIGHLSIYSCYAPLEDACEHRRGLERLRRAVERRLGGASVAGRDVDLRHAFAASVHDPDQGHAGGDGIRAHVSLHVSKWLGSTHVTSPVLEVDEAMALRDRLLGARDTGWAAFREVWIELLQHERHPPRLRRSRAEAEDYADRTFARRAAAAPGGRGAAPGTAKRRSCHASLQAPAVCPRAKLSARQADLPRRDVVGRQGMP